MVDQEDVSKNIGIRIVSKLASAISYQNVPGLNVLSIRPAGKKPAKYDSAQRVIVSE